MTLPVFDTLTSHEIVIDLSRPAMQFIVQAINDSYATDTTNGEVDNFRNLLQNLLDRSEPQNLDLVGG